MMTMMEHYNAKTCKQEDTMRHSIRRITYMITMQMDPSGRQQCIQRLSDADAIGANWKFP
jgi:hypothetical protein